MIEDELYNKELIKKDIRYKRIIELQISMDVC
jgi:hypothetical protein